MMPGQQRQTSYASSYDRSNYSQSEPDRGDDSTIGDTEDRPATTSDKHLGASETTPEKARSPSEDDSNIVTSLSAMLIYIRNDMEEKLLHAFDKALSLESQHNEDPNDAKLLDLNKELAETKNKFALEISRKAVYKNQGKDLMERNKILATTVNELSRNVETLTAQNKAARERAMEIFG